MSLGCFGISRMKKFASFGLIILSFSMFSQDLSKSYRTIKTDLGRLYNGDTISVKTYSFNYSFFDKEIDTTNHVVYFTVREKDGSGKFYKNNGFQYAMNIKNDSIIWANDVRKFDIAMLKDQLMISSDVATSKFNKFTGLEQFQHTGKLVYMDTKSKVGLTYLAPAKGMPKVDMKAVDIDDGDVKFVTKIPSEFDWVEAIKANDSMLLITSSGIHGINLRTGAKWSVDDVTGERNKQKLVQSIINTNAFRVKQSSFFESEFDDVTTQICSNMLIDGDDVYFASKNNLYCIDINDGKVNWKTDLSKYPTSKSALFTMNGKIYLLNLGVANFKENQIVYGAPYLLQVEMASGEVNFQNPLPMFAYPVDFIINTDLVLAGKNNLYFINLNDGKFFNEIDVNELRYGNFVEFVSGNEYYVEKEGYFVPLNFINDNVIYFRSTHGKVYGVEGGRIQYEYHESELYKLDKGFGTFKLIKQKFKTYVLNGNFELVAVLDMEDLGTVIGDKLYYFSGRKMHILHGSDFRK